MTNKQDNIPEAVASVTYSLETPDGFNILYTVRAESGSALLQAMRKVIEPELKFQGYKPQVKGSFGSRQKKEVEYVQGKVCPKCGSPVVAGATKDGSTFHKCSTQKYDFATKTRSGCDYFEFIDNSKQET